MRRKPSRVASLPVQIIQQHKELADMSVVRLELRAWGNWWRRHEYGQGYARRSAIDKMKDPIWYGRGVRPERELQPPPYVGFTGRRIDELSEAARRAVRAEYLCQGKWALCGFDSRKTFLYWLRRAELALLL